MTSPYSSSSNRRSNSRFNSGIARLRFTNCFVSEPLALAAHHGARSALLIVHAECLPRVVAEIKLGEIAMQMALIAVLVWGGMAYTKLGQQEDPTIPQRTAMLVTQFPGATA